MKSQNDSPASTGQKLSKQIDNMGNREPSDRQTLTVIRNFIFIHAVINCGINIVFLLLIS